jgi:hypothetical protein
MKTRWYAKPTWESNDRTYLSAFLEDFRIKRVQFAAVLHFRLTPYLKLILFYFNNPTEKASRTAAILMIAMF